MSVKLTLKGFDDYIRRLQRAGANVQKVTEKALNESAVMFNDALIKNVNASAMSQETKNRMMEDIVKPGVNHSSDMLVIADAGFRIGDDYHDTNDDLSGGFIALFNEYGTGERRTRKKGSRGSLEKMEFTKRAHKQVDSKIRKLQKGILEEALKELNG